MATKPQAPQKEAPKESKQYKVLRHLLHDKKQYKPGDQIGEDAVTPEQVKVLKSTGTIEE